MGLFTIEFTRQAYKEYIKLPRNIQIQLGRVFNAMERFPFKGDVKKLRTPFEGYRIRSGSYRILFTIKQHAITVYSVKHRKDAYML